MESCSFLSLFRGIAIQEEAAKLARYTGGLDQSALLDSAALLLLDHMAGMASIQAEAGVVDVKDMSPHHSQLPPTRLAPMPMKTVEVPSPQRQLAITPQRAPARERKAKGTLLGGADALQGKKISWSLKEEIKAPLKASLPEQISAPQMPEQCTTVIVKNYNGPFGSARLLSLWAPNGAFDYVEVPYAASDKCFKEFVIINFVTPECAASFAKVWNGQFVHRSQKLALKVCPFYIQGVGALLERFRGKDLRKLKKHGHLPMLFDGTARLDTMHVLELLFQS